MTPIDLAKRNGPASVLALSRRIDFYRDRAKRTRELAAQIQDEGVKNEILHLADRYEMMAKEAGPTH